MLKFFSLAIGMLAAVLVPAARAETPSKSSLAPECTPLSFQDLFASPVGPRGLDYTATLRSLEGRRVQLTGFMVRETNVDPDLFLFSATPVTTYACESLAAADLPPNVVQVMLESQPGRGVAWRPQRLVATGVLELGPSEERDGRISYVRLRADQVVAADTREPIDLHIPLVRRVLGATSLP